MDEGPLDAWYGQKVTELKDKHATQDLWQIPREEWRDLQREYADKLRALHGRDPQTGEKTPQRVADDRRAAQEAEQEGFIITNAAQQKFRVTIKGLPAEEVMARLRGKRD